MDFYALKGEKYKNLTMEKRKEKKNSEDSARMKQK